MPSEEQNQLEEVTITAGDKLGTFDITRFLALISENGLAKTNKYKATIFSPPGTLVDTENLTYYCENIEFPGRSLNVSEIKVYGPSWKAPNASLYNEITATFLCDKFLNQKKIFDDWMDYINPVNNFDFEYRDSYISTIEIIQCDEQDEFVEGFYKIVLLEAYPISIAPMAGNWGDDNFHRVNVTFTYRYHEIYQPTLEE